MDSASHRACAHCRSQKVRCIPDDDNPDVCQRCARSGRSCVFTPLQKRKQRKRTDTRVAELEREMRAMRALLKSKQEASRNSVSEPPSPGTKQPAGEGSAQRPHRAEGLWFNDPSGNDNRGANAVGFWVHNTAGKDGVAGKAIEAAPNQEVPAASKPVNFTFPDKPRDGTADVVDRGIVSMASARTLFDVYRNELFLHYPTVHVPDHVTADEMRRSKPVLFLAIIAAAAMKNDPGLSTVLDQEILKVYAQRTLVESEKSVEIIQALLVSAVWYHPPNKFGQLKYYQYIHWAATMALDIHIGERASLTRTTAKATGFYQPGRLSHVHHAEDVHNPSLSLSQRQTIREPETNNIEARRTFLACYAICAGVSLSLRRPSMLRVNSYVRECIEYLQTSPNAVPTDRSFVAWCKLMIISEEICQGFSYDDYVGMGQIEDLRTQLMLRDFEKRLSDWEKSIPDTDFNASLRIMYYTVRIYLNEIALHVDHNPEDFKAPYQMGPLAPRPPPNDDNDYATQPLVNAISDCITSAHRLMDTFLHIDPASARGLPVFTYVRVSLAAFVLAKLCLSAAHPEGRIYKVLDRSALKVEGYMDRAILHVRNIIGPHSCRVPAIFLALLFKLRSWCLHPELIEKYGDEHADSMAQRDRSIVVNAASGPNDGAYASSWFPPSPRIIERGSSVDESNSPGTSSNKQHTSMSPSTVTSHASPETASGGQPATGTVFNFNASGRTPDSGSDAFNTTRLPAVSQSNINTTSMPSSAGMSPSNFPMQQTGGGSVPIPNDPNTLAAWLNSTSMPPTESMDLDSSNNFFDLFGGNGEESIFNGGGLTGLEDWSNMPLMQDMMNSQPGWPQGAADGTVGGMAGNAAFFQGNTPESGSK